MCYCKNAVKALVVLVTNETEDTPLFPNKLWIRSKKCWLVAKIKSIVENVFFDVCLVTSGPREVECKHDRIGERGHKSQAKVSQNTENTLKADKTCKQKSQVDEVLTVLMWKLNHDCGIYDYILVVAVLWYRKSGKGMNIFAFLSDVFCECMDGVWMRCCEVWLSSLVGSNGDLEDGWTGGSCRSSPPCDSMIRWFCASEFSCLSCLSMTIHYFCTSQQFQKLWQRIRDFNHNKFLLF